MNHQIVSGDTSPCQPYRAAAEQKIVASIDSIDDQFERVFDMMASVCHQAALIETFARINDAAGVRRQLRFLQAHVQSAAIASSRIDELKACQAVF